MSVSEEDRFPLLSVLTETIGAGLARTIMESLPPTRWDKSAGVSGACRVNGLIL